MASWRPDDDVVLTDSDDEEDEHLRDFSKGREVILFVIDAGMLGKSDRFAEALDIVRKAFISALLVNDKDLMGVMFANTEHSPTPIEANCLDNIVVPANCAVLLPLRQLSKAIVEYLIRFLNEAPKTFGDRYGSGYCNFASMVRLCCSLFQHCGYERNNASIVYLTDCELPHEVNTPNYQRALMKAKDLSEQGVEFHVIPMVDDFNYDAFYKEFLTLVRDVEIDSFDPSDARQLREVLADRKLKQDTIRRTLGNFEFSLGAGLELSARYFNYFKQRIYPRKKLLLRKDNSVVEKKRKIIVRKKDAETFEYLNEREVVSTTGWYEIKVGSEPAIRISNEQITRVRNLHKPGMMLLGFKPASTLPENFYYRPSNFMYPDDSKIAGSKRLFRALWQRCYERKKIAVCLFMPKLKSKPRYVALVPVKAQDATESAAADNHLLLSGDGFKIVYLPFDKNIRHINFAEWNSIENEAPAEGVEYFEKVIRKLRLRYQPNLFNDPLLEVLQAQLLALALNIETENGGRTEMPEATEQDERIKHLLPQMNELFGEDEVAKATKRKFDDAVGGAPRAKIDKITEEQLKSYDFVEQLIANDTLGSCTVLQLRLVLNEHYGVKAPPTLKKQELISRIKELNVN